MQRHWTQGERHEAGTATNGPGDKRASRLDRRRLAIIALELVVTSAIMAGYFAARGLRPDTVDTSVARSLEIIRFEQRLGIFQEVTWQQMFVSNDAVMYVANFVYAWLHYPVMLVIGLWLLVKDPARYRFVRNVLVVSALIGIAAYWLIPAAPPRLMEINGYDFGFIDTVHGPGSTVSYFQPGPFVNDYAALPSFHFGWIALSSAAIWVNTTNRWIRTGAVIMSVVMWWAVTVTGNHYFFDMAMGGIVVFLSWLLVASIQRRRERRPAEAFAESRPVPGTNALPAPFDD